MHCKNIEPLVHRDNTYYETLIQKWTLKNIRFTEDVVYDAVRLKIGDDLTLLFCSEHSYHKEPSEWTTIEPETLNLRLSSFYLGS